MAPHEDDRRWVFALALAAWAALAGLTLAGLLTVLKSYRSADYPGAMMVSDHQVYRVVPHLYFKRDTSYRTSDPFPVVYNWYSNGFELGPEAHAQSRCILMAKNAASVWFVERKMSVMLCDAPSGRMVFVMRSLAVHYRQ